jgi:hypothetical protein
VRKKNPNDVIDDYVELASDSLSTWKDVCAALSSAPLKKRVSADAFLNVAIGWESFVSDWHLAAINRDSSAFAAHLETRAKNRLRGEFPGLVTEGLVRVDLPKHPSLDLVKTLVDPDGANVAMGDRSKWRTRVEAELCDPYKVKVLSLGAGDHKLIGAVVGIRNCLAHRSTRATDTMNDRLSALASRDRDLRPPGDRRVLPSSVGHYLNARVSTWQARVEVYHQRLAEIAEQLRV